MPSTEVIHLFHKAEQGSRFDLPANVESRWLSSYGVENARAALSKARSEYRSISKLAQEFLERALGADAATGDKAL